MKSIIFIALVIFTQTSFAQITAADSLFNWYPKMKHTALSKTGQTYISFGGDIRLQYFHLRNENWGEAPNDKDGYVFSRYLLHADLQAGKYVRAFIQLQGSMANSKPKTSPVDENPMDLHQAFVDFNISPTAKSKAVFRLGRQELSYGSQRLVSFREGPNNRQAFDGAKLMLSSGNSKLDLFFTHYVAAQKGIFDDKFNTHTKFWGTYLTQKKIPFLQNIELYYLGLWKEKASYDDGQGRELRHSVGTRIYGKNKGWKYDAEALYQFGKFGQSNIHAWTASLNAGYQFEKIKYKPEVGLKTEWISGDKQVGDGKLQSFNPLFPRGAYFGLASIIGPSNLFDVHPSINFTLAKQLIWTIDYDAFWRYSANDGIYAPNVALIYSGKNISDKYIGQQLSTDLVYTPNTFLYFRAEFTWFIAGDYLKKVSPGKDILFSGITMQVKF